MNEVDTLKKVYGQAASEYVEAEYRFERAKSKLLGAHGALTNALKRAEEKQEVA